MSFNLIIVFLVAFAEMFFILFRKTPVCSEVCASPDGWVFPHCTFSDSLIKIFTMMLCEVGGVNRYQQKLVSQLLYIAFVFLVVIVLSNVLIAMVTDSHSYIKYESVEIVFWSNRLDFVAEMETIVFIKQKLLNCLGKSHDYKSTSTEDSEIEIKTSREPVRQLWMKMIGFLWNDSSFDDTAIVKFLLFTIMRFFVVTTVLPIWVILGIASAGGLFPPHVREWLFVHRDPYDTVLVS